jgi:hypothetical protein
MKPKVKINEPQPPPPTVTITLTQAQALKLRKFFGIINSNYFDDVIHYRHRPLDSWRYGKASQDNFSFELFFALDEALLGYE